MQVAFEVFGAPQEVAKPDSTGLWTMAAPQELEQEMVLKRVESRLEELRLAAELKSAEQAQKMGEEQERERQSALKRRTTKPLA